MARSTDITAFAITMLLALATGCCRLPTARHARAPLPVPAAVEREYAPNVPSDLTHREVGSTNHGDYILRQVELRSPVSPYATNRTIRLDCFIPPSETPCPVLLVLPILGGKDYPLERHFAKYFARKGFASIIVHRELKGKPSEAAQIEGWLRQTILDNKQALDWVETQAVFDPDRIGLFGISMGGIKGAMLAPLDRRIKAATLGLAGEDLPYILSQTTEAGIARQRKAFLKENQMPIEVFHQRLQEGLTCDPAKFAPYVDPHKTFLVLGFFDTVVPIKKGLELRADMGKPETLFVPGGHYSSILFIHYIRYRCFRFFKKHLL